MTTIIRRSIALLGVALALSGCVVYPAGYRYRPAVAVAAPCCAYVGGYGYRRWN
jgi:hypothetical protein